MDLGPIIPTSNGGVPLPIVSNADGVVGTTIK